MTPTLSPAARADAATSSEELVTRLTMREHLPLSVLVRTLDAQLKILRDIERGMTGQRRATTEWVVTRLEFDGETLEYALTSAATLAAKRAQTSGESGNTPPSSVSHQPQTKTAPDVACDYAEGLTTNAVGGR